MEGVPRLTVDSWHIPGPCPLSASLRTSKRSAARTRVARHRPRTRARQHMSPHGPARPSSALGLPRCFSLSFEILFSKFLELRMYLFGKAKRMLLKSNCKMQGQDLLSLGVAGAPHWKGQQYRAEAEGGWPTQCQHLSCGRRTAWPASPWAWRCELRGEQGLEGPCAGQVGALDGGDRPR